MNDVNGHRDIEWLRRILRRHFSWPRVLAKLKTSQDRSRRHYPSRIEVRTRANER